MTHWTSALNIEALSEGKEIMIIHSMVGGLNIHHLFYIIYLLPFQNQESIVLATALQFVSVYLLYSGHFTQAHILWLDSNTNGVQATDKISTPKYIPVSVVYQLAAFEILHHLHRGIAVRCEQWKQ